MSTITFWLLLLNRNMILYSSTIPIFNSSEEAKIEIWLCFQLSIFSQQIRHRTAIVSCGLFTIDWPLAFSVSLIHPEKFGFPIQGNSIPFRNEIVIFYLLFFPFRWYQRSRRICSLFFSSKCIRNPHINKMIINILSFS